MCGGYTLQNVDSVVGADVVGGEREEREERGERKDAIGKELDGCGDAVGEERGPRGPRGRRGRWTVWSALRRGGCKDGACDSHG